MVISICVCCRTVREPGAYLMTGAQDRAATGTPGEEVSPARIREGAPFRGEPGALCRPWRDPSVIPQVRNNSR